ncbi:aldehyde dehydrogenase [Marinobacter sp.]|jgi:lactaldehyde dehydrogenase / glycolaldehyde dehydrogenase|uniref:aldehyde dehydrogenase n=1 Tax=Marinobacter sp. TaxID=50741 RepID=UPI003B51FD6E
MKSKYQNYIDNQFVDSTSGDFVEVKNPATFELLSVVPASNAADVERAVEASRKAQPAWEKLPANERANYIRRIASKLREHKERLARTITLEQGKVLDLARVEVDFTADYMDYMAEWARRIEGEIIQSDRPNETIYLYRRPIGVVAGILPWNFPFFLVARKMAPALVTGNTIVIKSSEETPINAFEFAELAAECDLPPGVFNVVSGRGDTGAALTAHKDVGLITFTGSVETGVKIMESAARNVTKVNLELGGKAPAIVLNDADLDLTAAALHGSRILNTGQVCNCAERVYVQRGVAEELAQKVTKLMAETRYGDPIAESDLQMGPLMNEEAVKNITRIVDSAKQQGAEILTGGKVSDRLGYHYEPTVLTGCKPSMDAMTQEIFGPVLPFQVVDDLDEALAYANDTDYGLTSSVYTRDLNASMKAIRELRFGETYINRENFEAMQGFHAGRRKSGIGGADGKHGLYEFTTTQVVYMQNQ